MKSIHLVALAIWPSITIGGPVSLGPVQFTELAASTDSNAFNSQSGPGILSFINTPSFGGGMATATIVSDPSTGLFLSASATGETQASPSAFFGLEVTGPQDVNVPLDVSGFTAAAVADSVTGETAGSSAFITLQAGSSEFFAACSVVPSLEEACTGSNVIVGAGFFSATVLIPANTGILVDLVTGAATEDSNKFYGTIASSQLLGPYFQLDPNFAASNPDYSLNLASGFYNVPVSSSTPEPSSRWLVLSIAAATVLAALRHSISSHKNFP